MTKKENKFLVAIIFLIFITSSFDIFLTFTIAGFTFRISQILSMLLFVVFMLCLGNKKKMLMPIGYKWLLIWAYILLLFTFNTILPKINIVYHLWLIFNILIIFVFSEIGKDEENVKKIIKLYIYSFFILAILGILEFVLGSIGLNIPYIRQYWASTKIPRVNGFSYEPSYYATYLIIGWTFCRILYQKEVFLKDLIKKRMLLIIIITATIAIILSSSRLGILLIGILEFIIFIKNLIKMKKINYILLIMTSVFLAAVMIFPIYKSGKLDFALAGTGLNGTSAHSVSIRGQDLDDTVEVFKQSPMLGKGLGGIYAEIAKNRGLDVNNIQVQKEASGMNIFAEVLAASGMIGFVFFIIYLIILIGIYWKINKFKNIDKKEKDIMKALIIALMMELIILQFNQNILRMYFWVHIGVITMYYEYLVRLNKEREKNESSC